jgi:hypothetical protein
MARFALPAGRVAVTMPPWPGAGEAVAVEGPWAPTGRQRRSE